ncbi:nucleotidyltransferase domain-containing protein [Roseomonas hellenica]|uniref:Nucleotidyltransferase domain-containing protein n=1 Tax=Plastoroseomonas hellenica TaxID=2687306 RepID=A0ABS5EV00_9PROT|nr:nucleotidyltransferase domain-containing protein [Plastoroseomonas hellenica]MBR0664117.1 nucleotidyltransferase domain-containing protein [Plastoroseomonas hellenica]
MRVSAAARAAIGAALDAIIREEQVAILFAVESGSRAWGFPSPDSDWDVRFVYARPTAWHITLTPGRDTLERSLPGDIDLAGWDARKALNLLLNGNAALREWLRSPILYCADSAMLAEFRALADALPARAAARHHYRAVIRQISSRYLDGRAVVNLKKYLYVVRPALALRWLREHPEGEPPMDMPALLAEVTLDAAARADLDGLLVRKAEAAELGEGARLARLDALVADEIEAAAAMPDEPRDAPGAAAAALALYRRATAHADAVLA